MIISFKNTKIYYFKIPFKSYLRFELFELNDKNCFNFFPNESVCFFLSAVLLSVCFVCMESIFLSKLLDGFDVISGKLDDANIVENGEVEDLASDEADKTIQGSDLSLTLELQLFIDDD